MVPPSPWLLAGVLSIAAEDQNEDQWASRGSFGVEGSPLAWTPTEPLAGAVALMLFPWAFTWPVCSK